MANISIEEDDIELIEIKDEPMDDYEYALVSQSSLYSADDPLQNEFNPSHDSFASFVDTTPDVNVSIANNLNSDNSGTRNLFVNGLEGACSTTTKEQFRNTMANHTRKEDTPINSANLDSSNVQCPRCKRSVSMEGFRQHIDACPPKKISRKTNETFNNTSVQNDISTIETNYLPAFGESNLRLIHNPYFAKVAVFSDEHFKDASSNFSSSPDAARVPVDTQTNINNVSEEHIYNNGNDSLSNSENKLFSLLSEKRKRDDDSDSVDPPSKIMNRNDTELEDVSIGNNVRPYPTTSDHQSEGKSDDHDYQKHSEPRRTSIDTNIDISSNKVISTVIEDESVTTRDGGNSSGNMESNESTYDNYLIQDSTLSCSVCSFTTYKERVLRDHERNHRTGKKPIYHCVYCNQKYSKASLIIHIQTDHPGLKVVITEDMAIETANERITTTKGTDNLDGTVTVTRSKVTSRKIIKNKGHGNIGQVQETKPTVFKTNIFRCHKCSYSSKLRIKLNLHMKRHHSQRLKSSSSGEPTLFECSVCSFTTSSQHSLELHKKSHQTNMPLLNCNRCDYSGTAFAMRRHSFKCGQVEKAIQEKSSNSAKELVKCKLCSHTIANTKSVNFKRHMSAHKRNVPMRKCAYCSFFSTYHVLARHVEKDHSNEMFVPRSEDTKVNPEPVKPVHLHLFKCRICKFCTNLRTKLNSHLKTHQKVIPSVETFRCSSCAFSSTYKSSLHRHQARIHGRRKKRKRPNHNAVDQSKHEKASNEEDNLLHCSKCSFSTDMQSELEKHQDIHLNDFKTHENPIPSLRTFQCRHCTYSTFRKRDLIRHEKGIHRSSKTAGKFRCRYCPYAARYKVVLYRHEKYVHGWSNLSSNSNPVNQGEDKKDTTQEANILHCNVCSFSTDMFSELQSHQASHLNYFKCNLCSAVTKTRETYEQHMLTHEDKRVQKCPLCNYKASKANLYVHMKEHKDKKVVSRKSKQSVADDAVTVEKCSQKRVLDKLIKCNLCSFVGYPHVVKLHSTSHNNNPTEQCPHCNFRSTPIQMYRHAIIHVSPSDSFKCKLCSFRAVLKISVTRHMRSHVNKHPIKKCAYCNFKSTQKYLAYHISVEHYCLDGEDDHSQSEDITKPESRQEEENTSKTTSKSVSSPLNTLKCTKCSFITWRKGALVRHMSSHNNSMPVKKCKYCEFKSTPRHLETHIKEHVGVQKHSSTKEGPIISKSVAENNFSSKPDRPHKCRLCSYAAIRARHLEYHMRLHKRKKPVNKCPHCMFRATPHCLGVHIKKNHADKVPGVKNDNLSSVEKDRSTELAAASSARGEEKEFELENDVNESAVVENGAKMYKCKLCSFIGNQVYSFKQHMMAHKKKQPIKKCPRCSFHSTPRQLISHISRHSKNDVSAEESDRNIQNKHSNGDSKATPVTPAVRSFRLYKCEFCSYANVRIGDFQKHLLTHDKKQPVLKCPYCIFNSTPAYLRKHIPKHSNPAEGNPPLMKCPYCTSEFTPARIFKHIKEHEKKVSGPENQENIHNTHSKQKSSQDKAKKMNNFDDHETNIGSTTEKSLNFQCSLCPFSTSLRIKLNIHTKKNHPDHVSGEDKETNQIPKKHTASVNIEDVSVAASFSCSLCSYKTPVETSLRKHENMHRVSNLPILKCTNCNFKGTEPKLKTHAKLCAKDCLKTSKMVLQNCPSCSFTTYSPVEFKSHKENHADSKVVKNIGTLKLFKCEFCSFSSYWKTLMDRHMDSHTVLKLPVESCPRCDFRSTPAALTAHVNQCKR